MSAVVFGDPHFVTFDGVSYSFNGKGEYTLVTSAETHNLTIQGRTEPVNGEKALSFSKFPVMFSNHLYCKCFHQQMMTNPSVYKRFVTIPFLIALILPPLETIKATKMTSVAMKEANSDVIEVRLSGHTGLEVLQNQKTLSFTEQSWMDLHGETLTHLFCFKQSHWSYYFWLHLLSY